MAPSTVKLASGHEMPLVGFGLWKVPADQAAETVYNVKTHASSRFNCVNNHVGHQVRIQTLRRSIRLPKRKGSGPGYPARYQGGTCEA